MIIENNPEPVDDLRPFGTMTLLFETEEERTQARILLRALSVYAERNVLYNDNWRRFGWRGCLFRLRERAERAWDALWDHSPLNPKQSQVIGRPVEPVLDDLIDLINFAAFTIRAVHDGNRDGSWW